MNDHDTDIPKSSISRLHRKARLEGLTLLPGTVIAIGLGIYGFTPSSRKFASSVAFPIHPLTPMLHFVTNIFAPILFLVVGLILAFMALPRLIRGASAEMIENYGRLYLCPMPEGLNSKEKDDLIIQLCLGNKTKAVDILAKTTSTRDQAIQEVHRIEKACNAAEPRESGQSE